MERQFAGGVGQFFSVEDVASSHISFGLSKLMLLEFGFDRNAARRYPLNPRDREKPRSLGQSGRRAASLQQFPTALVFTAHGGARLTSTASQSRSASVLIVDRSEESRDVLRTILEKRGVNILEAKQGVEGLELLRELHPSLVVLDLEEDEGDSEGLRGRFEDESRRHETPLVLLGRVKGEKRSENADKAPDVRHIVEKPYHYEPLIRTIEQLLRQHNAVA